MSVLLIPLNSEALIARLIAQTRALVHRIAELEGRIRRFESLDRGLYDAWIRGQLGPLIMALEELYREIHIRRGLARRVDQLMGQGTLSPREALYVARFGANPEGDSQSKRTDDSGAYDEDEVRARKRAKLEAKRAERKQQKKDQKDEKRKAMRTESRDGSTTDSIAEDETGATSDSGPDRLRTLYRNLARRLHPDSPHLIQTMPRKLLNDLWHEVQAAYEVTDVDRLLSIALWIGDEIDDQSETVRFTLSVSERMEQIRAFEKTCRTLDKRIRQLSKDPAWEFEKKPGSDRKRLLKAAARQLETELSDAQGILVALDEWFDSIGPPRAPKSAPPSGRRGR